MNIIEPLYIVKNRPDREWTLQLLESAARTCYKSEDHIKAESASKLIKALMASGHESVIEHVNVTVKFICDRGISHELVRHRLASYSQESTRYANYSKHKFNGEITVIRPSFFKRNPENYHTWCGAMRTAEYSYMQLLRAGATAQEARSVLPNSLKTEVVMTANLREWNTIFKQRCSLKAHPQMRELMRPLMEDFYSWMPEIYEKVYQKYHVDRDEREADEENTVLSPKEHKWKNKVSTVHS